MNALLALLERELGLDPSSIGMRSVERVVQRRAAARNLDVEAYAASFTPDELTAIIDELVVPETWFFRDLHPFKLLARRALKLKRARPLRVLSVPCSTGEEPYSIAITLLEAGLLPHQFTVEAYDVSPRNLEAARTGVYGKNSFRGAAAIPKRDFFEMTPEGARVTSPARNCVRFSRANVLDPSFLQDSQRFDFVFCRNLLIYLTGDARTRVVALLESVLEEDGLLFMGHAEALERIDPRFRSTGDSGAFAYARGAPRRSLPAIVVPALKRRRRISPPPAPTPPAAPPVPRDPLADATQLADKGQLREAAALCQQALESTPSADLYSLLGVVQAASSELSAAERSFGKALYINPNHYQSLVQLSLLLKQRGERDGAANLLRRANRAHRKQK